MGSGDLISCQMLAAPIRDYRSQRGSLEFLFWLDVPEPAFDHGKRLVVAVLASAGYKRRIHSVSRYGSSFRIAWSMPQTRFGP
jgi:hypothetical protein